MSKLLESLDKDLDTIFELANSKIWNEDFLNILTIYKLEKLNKIPNLYIFELTIETKLTLLYFIQGAISENINKDDIRKTIMSLICNDLNLNVQETNTHLESFNTKKSVQSFDSKELKQIYVLMNKIKTGFKVSKIIRNNLLLDISEALKIIYYPETVNLLNKKKQTSEIEAKKYLDNLYKTQFHTKYMNLKSYKLNFNKTIQMIQKQVGLIDKKI